MRVPRVPSRPPRLWATLTASLSVPLVLVATLAGCLFSSPTPAPSAAGSGALRTAPVTPSASPAASPSDSPSPSPEPSIAPVAVKPEACPGTNRNPGYGSGRRLYASSANWSGYVAATRKTGVTCVEASWVEPSVTCPDTGHQAVAIWIGIDGFASKTVGIPATDVLVQIGTQADCSDGVAAHSAWYEILPGETNEVPIAARIQAGDHMSARISYESDSFTLVLYDEEAEGSFTLNAPAPEAPRKSAEWIVEAPAVDCPGTCAPIALPSFGSIRFTGAYVTIADQRSSINDYSWTNIRLKMVRAGITRANTSILTSLGTSFKVTWAHS